MEKDENTNTATINLLRNLNPKKVDGDITIKGNDGTNGDTSVTISNIKLKRDENGHLVDKENRQIDEDGWVLDPDGKKTTIKSEVAYDTTSQTFNTGSVVRANKDVGGDATNGEELTQLSINGKKYTITNSSANDWTPMVNGTEVEPTTQGTDTKKHVTFAGNGNIDVTANATNGTITIDGSQLAKKDLSNITTITGNGKTEIMNIAKDAVKVSNGNGIEVNGPTEQDGSNNYQVIVKADGNQGIQVTDNGVGVKLKNSENNENNLGVDKDGLYLKNELTGIKSISNGDTKISLDTNGVTISGGLNVDSQKITNVAVGEDNTDAVNVGQLNQAIAGSGWNLSVVGNDQPTAIKPNSNVTFDTANGVTISKEETQDKEGNVTGAKVKVGLENTIHVGDITIGQQPSGGANAEDGKYITGLDNKVWDKEKFVSGRAATEDQLKAVQNKISNDITTIGSKTFGLKGDSGTDEATNTLGNTVQVKGANGITSTVKGDALEIGLGNDITINGKDGKSGVGINGKDGISIKGADGKDGVTIKGIDGKDGVNGAEGHIGLNGKDGMTDIWTTAGKPGLDGKDGETMTRVVYQDPQGNKHEVATLDDGLKFKGDSGETISKKLNETLTIKGNAATNANLSDGNIGVINDNGDLIVKLNKNLTGLESAHFGTTVIDTNGLTVGSGDSQLRFTTNGVSVGNQQIKNVANGTDPLDAVNFSQLQAVQTTVDSGWNLSTDHGTSAKVALGTTVKITGDNNNITVSNTGTNVKIDLAQNLNGIESVKNGDSFIELNKEGTVTINNQVNINKDGKISGVADGDIAEGSKDAVNGSQLNKTNNRVTNVENKVKNIQNDITNINTNIQNIGDKVTNLDTRVTKIEQTAGAHSTVSTDKTDTNLSVTPTKNEKTGVTDYKVSLNKDLTLDSVTTGDTVINKDGVKVGEDVSLMKDGLTAGNTKVTNDGLSIDGKTYVTDKGLNANNQTITNVADGKVEKGSKDAVNGGQLYNTNQAVINNANNISNIGNALSNLDNRVNKVGAGAAALAALHPLDFDPDAKWDFAAGYGNYRGTNAAAVGAYYRPNEDTMFSVGGTFGNGENMVNAGVSFKLGAGSSHVSTSRVAMAKEIKELRGELEAMKSAMLDANAGKKIDTSKLQLFPDVPQNHWAYEYVTQLAGNGMIEGYPDGNFAGDRPMTRYEFAAILYRAMTKGAVLSDKILNEFSHELEYFTVDTVAKDKAGNPTIQRVRTVKANTNK